MKASKYLLALALTLGMPLRAQTNGSNSSYSRFGLGLLCDQSSGHNRSMGGVAQGLADGGIINMQNPASYARIDSITFLFDVGMSMHFAHYVQGAMAQNVRNTNLEYVNAAFRLRRGLGMSLGFVPLSAIGYNFQTQANIGTSNTNQQNITSLTGYYGQGGLHQFYLGAGWNPFAQLSIGANISYVWGNYHHAMSQSFHEGDTQNNNYNSQNLAWSSNIHTYKIDLGAQYPILINPTNRLSVGLSATLGHRIGSPVSMTRYTSEQDTLENKRSNAFELPYCLSTGLAWQNKGRWTVAADYELQRWAGCRLPMASDTQTNTIDIRTDQYLNRHTLRIGAELLPEPMPGASYFKRIRYRVGANYSTPYTRINGVNGPTEYSLSMGAALPLSLAGRSVLNIGMEWKHRQGSTSSQITENYLMLHLGVTINERWFMKWKLD